VGSHKWYANSSVTRVILRGALSMLLCFVAIFFFNMPSSAWLIAVSVPAMLTILGLARIRKMSSGSSKPTDA
jgi:hypothetical protein